FFRNEPTVLAESSEPLRNPVGRRKEREGNKEVAVTETHRRGSRIGEARTIFRGPKPEPLFNVGLWLRLANVGRLGSGIRCRPTGAGDPVRSPSRIQQGVLEELGHPRRTGADSGS